MSNELDEIKAILLQNTSQMATLLESQIRLQAAQDRTQQQLEQLTLKVDANATAIADLTRDTRASIEDLVNLGTETYEIAAQNANFIRGLQVENRRILRELRDRRRGAE